MHLHEYQAKRLFAEYGIPVPAGFTITTEVCTAYYKNKGKYPAGLEKQVNDALDLVGTFQEEPRYLL